MAQSDEIVSFPIFDPQCTVVQKLHKSIRPGRHGQHVQEVWFASIIKAWDQPSQSAFKVEEQGRCVSAFKAGPENEKDFRETCLMKT